MTSILVIEDDVILREEVKEWLTFEDYTVIDAQDGVLGIEYALRYLPDLIVCDITMPRVGGYEVLLEMRSNPATAGIPFMFLTARAAHEDIRQGMILGADDYITKPFTRLELLQAIRTRLEKKAVYNQERQREVEQWQQALEQEREQRILKAKLVAMFSHDFRTPLATILSSSNLLRDYSDRMDEARRLAHFNRLDASVRQLLQMLDDMLVVSQMETGSLDFKPESLHVGEFLQHIIDEFQTIQGETHRVVFENHLTAPVAADSRLLRQIAANLISNALKYSPQGSEVRVILGSQDGRWILTVRDQGVGIPEADQPRLFGAFQRGSNVGDVSGTGLGLAIVKQAVDLHSGEIYLESQEGVGTTITVAIPTQM